MKLSRSLVGLWLSIGLCSATPSALGSRSEPPVLPKHMRGVSTSASDLTADLFVLLAKTDVNILRVGINIDSDSELPPTALNPLAPYATNLAVLDLALPLAELAGIKLILTAGDPYGRKDDVMWQNTNSSESARKHLSLFWGAIAKKYAGHPAIAAYDILNEPNYPSGKSDLWFKEMLPDSIKTIRAVDRATWLVVEPGPWGLPSGFAFMPLLEDPYVIYSFHHYAPHSYTHQRLLKYPKPVTYPGDNSMWGDYPLTFWDKYTLRKSMQPAIDFARKNKVRMLVGEFGATRWAQGSDAWISDSISIFEEQGWDWCFHSIGGWNGWSPTYGSAGLPGDRSTRLQAPDGGDRGGRWQALTKGWSLNRLDPGLR